jgi:hypothetical protein
MSSDPFAAYRVNPIEDQAFGQSDESLQEDPFAQYRVQQKPKKEQSKESLGSNIGRQIGRTGARIAETVLGAPRAFGEFFESLVPEKTLIKAAEKIGLGEGAKNLLETTKKFAPYKLFPKSEDVRDLNKFLFGKKTEPQNEFEQKADNLVSDFTALALPLPGSKLKLLKPGLLALGGNIASEVVGQVGGTEKQQTYGKLGTFLAGSLINPKSADKLKNSLYKKADAARPKNAVVNANKLKNSVDHFAKELTKGDPKAASKSKSLNLMDNIKSKVKNGDIEVEELEQFKRDINEARASLFDEFRTNKPGRKAAKRNLDTVSKFVDNSLKEYGKKNPEWESFYRPANEVHGAIAQSKRVRNYIGSIAKKLGMTTLAAELGLYHFAGPGAALAGAEALVAGGAILGAGEIATRFLKSPTLRKHYVNLINSALKEDAVAVKQNLDKINEEFKNKKD